LATHSRPNIKKLAIGNLQIHFTFEFLKFEILFLVKFPQFKKKGWHGVLLPNNMHQGRNKMAIYFG
jgi:hypothetical protein